MPEPIRWESKIVMGKIETSYGVDPTPTGAANSILLKNVELRPMEGEDVARDIDLPYLCAQEEFPTALRVVLTGSVELVGSGVAGTAPLWGPLLRCCAAAQIVTANTKVEFVPVSDSHESGTFYFFVGPWLHKLLGARGTATVTINAQGIPEARFTMTGLFVRPVDSARPTAVLSGFQRPQVATKANTPTFTIGGQAFVMRNFALDLGCDVQPTMLVGQEEIVIVGKAEAITTTVRAVPAATYDPYATAEDGTPKAIALVHGTIAGKIVTITSGQARQKRLSGFEINQKLLEWPLAFTPRPTDAGNDQWKITLT